MYALRDYAYSPCCSFQEFLTRLKITGSHRISRDELAQRIATRRHYNNHDAISFETARALVDALDGEGRILCLEYLYAQLVRLFGHNSQQRGSVLQLLRPHLPRLAHLGLTAPTLRLDIPNGLAELFAAGGTVLGFKQKNDLTQALLGINCTSHFSNLEKRASLSCRDIVLKVAGGQTPSLRRAAVQATYARVARHCGIDIYSGHLTMQQLRSQLHSSHVQHNGVPSTVLHFLTRLPNPITLDDFLAYYDAISATVDGDIIFMNHLRDTWRGGHTDPVLDSILTDMVKPPLSS
uniref:Uncharacterized protein n=1 Tax=Aureoumbra lagunensis TaxID=44058 RepID=A0A7S3NH40_9STRA|eukprot:CAMPEP_0197323806 /NCGR_PEP_ID=MMETSP0891-20130614/70743_1 /TAXON_ID=44058 ORGANISM="Aureoumbra lagunensis, Strain CCMP1510" /NCGR_SAMPLE_ID=MMETSP0891 /ASSEMBLY_ACC=CAM_ASM_000534 /LENGTH=292 /DNA_ID=CAMNT_0042816525 /DNA_START=15 /DNA_END=893 /DNA_ORIENTATION=+